jgi:hypothetical protein
MIVMMSRINSAALYRSIRELMALAKSDTVPSFDEQIDEAGEGMGMDLETDLFDQIDGNLGLMINRVQFMGADAVMLMQLADPDAFYDTVDGIAGWIELALNLKQDGGKSGGGPPNQKQKAQMTEAEFDGVDYYKVMAPPAFEVCFGIVGDHFVVTVSETRFQAIVGGDGSFVETVGNRRVRETLAEPTGGVFYIDFEGVVRDLKAMAPMLGIKDGEIFEVLGQLSELTSVSTMDEHGMWSNTSLTAASPGVWKRLATWLLEEAAEEKEKDADPGETTD